MTSIMLLFLPLLSSVEIHVSVFLTLSESLFLTSNKTKSHVVLLVNGGDGRRTAGLAAQTPYIHK